MTGDFLSPSERARANELRRRTYAKEAPKYDRKMNFFERWFFGTQHRSWACSQAVGDTLEVAIGTALNLSFYPADVRLTGLDLSPEMLALTEIAAKRVGRNIEMKEATLRIFPSSTLLSIRWCAHTGCAACPTTPE